MVHLGLVPHIHSLVQDLAARLALDFPSATARPSPVLAAATIATRPFSPKSIRYPPVKRKMFSRNRLWVNRHNPTLGTGHSVSPHNPLDFVYRYAIIPIS